MFTVNKRPALNIGPGKEKNLFFEALSCKGVTLIINIFRVSLEVMIYLKSNKYPVFNKGILGGKVSEQNKNVLDYLHSG